jgi:8-oxo-dGTP diphosphatase
MIEKSLYDKIVSVIPIVGVEAMIVNDHNEILFLKRNNPPVKGEWWFAGGRIKRGETFEEALRREVKEETGLDIDIIRFIGVYNRLFPERHDITLGFLCKCRNEKVILNDEHSEYKFCKKIPSDINPNLLNIIKDSCW